MLTIVKLGKKIFIKKVSVSSPRLLDVARYARVSPATVSRVLNNTGPVNARTRERVLEAMTTLGYNENGAKTLIALLITDILNPFFSELVQAVEDEIEDSGFGLMLFNASEETQREQKALRSLASWSVKGIISCTWHTSADDLVALHAQNNTPLVVINRRIDHPEIPCIVVDFKDAMYRATRHLLGLHHKRIAYLSGYGSSETSRVRRHGIELALAEVGLQLPPTWCPTSFPSIEGGFQAMSALLDLVKDKRPTAVIAYNDLMAIGALQAIRIHGLRVPDDISVVGCDGIAMTAHSNPPLTTIDQPKYRMGQMAIQTVRQMLEDQEMFRGGYTLLESRLVIRESTGPCTNPNA
jgi:DNA-binding LacI/PurR family transcriptional regulator